MSIVVTADDLQFVLDAISEEQELARPVRNVDGHVLEPNGILAVHEAENQSPSYDLHTPCPKSPVNIIYEDEGVVFYLSNQSAAVDKRFLLEQKIGVVVNMAGAHRHFASLSNSLLRIPGVYEPSLERVPFDTVLPGSDWRLRDVGLEVYRGESSQQVAVDDGEAALDDGEAAQKKSAVNDGEVAAARFYNDGCEVEHYLEIAAEDLPDYDLRPDVQRVWRFLTGEVGVGGQLQHQHQRRILINCVMGQNRSCCVSCAVLMRYRRWSAREAVAHVARRRFYVLTNEGFLRLLAELENEGWHLNDVVVKEN